MKHWRLAGALTLSAAAAVAFVAVNRSSPSSVAKSDAKARTVRKLGRDDAEKLKKNMMAMPGREREGGPMAATEEDYANRAFPAAYIPFQLTTNAQKAWGKTKPPKNKNKAGIWTLIGPSSANFPDVLTFSGAAYTTSGRVTALAIAPNCGQGHCYLYLGAAGGGVWKTDKALHTNPSQKWEFISGSFATNAIGTLVIDPTDPTGKTLYAGTGESHASADSEAGFGIYKTTDGGDTWTHLAANTNVPAGSGVDCTALFGFGGFQAAPAYSGPAFDGRSISSIVVDPNNPNVLYVSSARGVRGVSSVSSGGAVSLAPGLPPYGLWKSTDGGANFTLLNSQDVCLNPTLAGSAGIIQASFGSSRGVNRVELDPSTADVDLRGCVPAKQRPAGQHQRGYLALDQRRRDLDADQDGAQCSTEHRPRRIRCHQVGERQDSDVRGRRQCRGAGGALLPHRRCHDGNQRHLHGHDHDSKHQLLHGSVLV